MKSKYLLIIFDLDDTLYPEHTYVMSGFRAVANYVCKQCALNYDAIYDYLCFDFEANGRGKNFDNLIRNFSTDKNDLASNPVLSRENMIRIYQEHLPDIRIDPKIIVF